MSITVETTITPATSNQRQQVIHLLEEENLPVADLSASLNNFFVAIDNDKVVGAIGLELYGNNGLLRSMVVSKGYRKRHIASALIAKLESHAKTIGISCIYLLTETAAQYFETKGYEIITRNEVPEELKVSSEFSYVCPSSAIVMKKLLK